MWNWWALYNIEMLSFLLNISWIVIAMQRWRVFCFINVQARRDGRITIANSELFVSKGAGFEHDVNEALRDTLYVFFIPS